MKTQTQQLTINQLNTILVKRNQSETERSEIRIKDFNAWSRYESLSKDIEEYEKQINSIKEPN